MTLAEFLLARIAEDEAAVRAEYARPELDARRGLAECEAKRRIIEIHGSLVQVIPWVDEERNAEDARRGHTWCTECGNVDDQPVAWPCDTLRLLALPYADHPDYSPEWRSARDGDDPGKAG
jgi:hypothetical protein